MGLLNHIIIYFRVVLHVTFMKKNTRIFHPVYGMRKSCLKCRSFALFKFFSRFWVQNEKDLFSRFLISQTCNMRGNYNHSYQNASKNYQKNCWGTILFQHFFTWSCNKTWMWHLFVFIALRVALNETDKHVISNCQVEWYWCWQRVGSPFSCYSKENYIVKYPLLSLSGFPYRITQYIILKFPILIIAEILASNTLIYKITWACTQEHKWSYR